MRKNRLIKAWACFEMPETVRLLKKIYVVEGKKENRKRVG